MKALAYVLCVFLSSNIYAMEDWRCYTKDMLSGKPNTELFNCADISLDEAQEHFDKYYKEFFSDEGGEKIKQFLKELGELRDNGLLFRGENEQYYEPISSILNDYERLSRMLDETCLKKEKYEILLHVMSLTRKDICWFQNQVKALEVIQEEAKRYCEVQERLLGKISEEIFIDDGLHMKPSQKIDCAKIDLGKMKNFFKKHHDFIFKLTMERRRFCCVTDEMYACLHSEVEWEILLDNYDNLILQCEDCGERCRRREPQASQDVSRTLSTDQEEALSKTNGGKTPSSISSEETHPLKQREETSSPANRRKGAHHLNLTPPSSSRWQIRSSLNSPKENNKNAVTKTRSEDGFSSLFSRPGTSTPSETSTQSGTSTPSGRSSRRKSRVSSSSSEKPKITRENPSVPDPFQ